MSIGAYLHHLNLTSPDPVRMGAYYQRTHGLVPVPHGEAVIGATPGRLLMWTPGQSGQLGYAMFAFHDEADWRRFKARELGAAKRPLPTLAVSVQDAVAIEDPDGNCTVFAWQPGFPAEQDEALDLPEAHMQHFAMRTQDPDRMRAFYHEVLGFGVSDRVEDPSGTLRACFLRTDSLHHSLALFGAPTAGFDHFSFETTGWDAMKHWGDHMARVKETIVWGIGRHGPGDDVFFMVRDPDGNLAEVSAEIEVCAADRPTGLWPHEERTLNQWGKAIMRD